MNRQGYFPTRRRPTCCTACTRPRRCCSKKGLTTSSRATIGTPKRRAARSARWGLEILCRNPAEYSGALTAVLMPDRPRRRCASAARSWTRYDLSLGMGLGKLAGSVFRISHLGFFNDLTLCGALCGVEMGLAVAQVPHQREGVDEALAYLQERRTVQTA